MPEEQTSKDINVSNSYSTKERQAMINDLLERDEDDPARIEFATEFLLNDEQRETTSLYEVKGTDRETDIRSIGYLELPAEDVSEDEEAMRAYFGDLAISQDGC